MPKKVRVKSPSGEYGYISEDRVDLAIERGFSLAEKPEANRFDYSPIGYTPETFVGSTSNVTRRMIAPYMDVTYPLTNPLVRKLQEKGDIVRGSVEDIAGRVAESGNPLIATGLSVLGDVGALTPENLILGIGSEIFPVGAAPFATRAGQLGRSIGNKFIGTPLKSLRKSIRRGIETLGEKFLKSKLPANREEAFAEASNLVEDLETEIQKRLDETVLAGRTQSTSIEPVRTEPLQIGYDPKEVVPTEIASPPIFPPGDIARLPNYPKFEEWGRLPDYNVESPTEMRRLAAGEGGFQTLGGRGERGRFQKGGGKGEFFIEDPSILKKQKEYIDDILFENIERAKNEFRRRASTPEYGFNYPSKYAISRDEIGKSIDSVISKFKKTGTEDDTVNSLTKMKDAFLSTHPNVADVQYWNGIKRSLYRLVGDNGYLAQNTTAKVEALKAIAKSIQKRIETIIPGIKELNAVQGEYRAIRNALGDTIASRSKRIGSIREDLKDEAKVLSARRGFGKNIYKTRGLGGIAVSLPFEENRR